MCWHVNDGSVVYNIVCNEIVSVMLTNHEEDLERLDSLMQNVFSKYFHQLCITSISAKWGLQDRKGVVKCSILQ